MHRLAIILTAFALVGCQTRPVVPKIVHVQVEKFVPLPESLTSDCDTVAKRENTVGEAVRLALARLESLKACNANMARIRAMGK